MTIEQLTKKLNFGSYTERLAAIDALGGLRDPQAIAPLQASLGDTDTDVRIAALRSLERLLARIPSSKYFSSSDTPNGKTAMASATTAPDAITLEFLDTNLGPVQLLDLGRDFLDAARIDARDARRPFRIALERKDSKAGNHFYDYSQNGVPLPDGLNTYLRLEGAIIPMGRIHPSKTNKHPTREGTAEIVVGGVVYKVTAYLTEGKTPFYVKVLAHKKPNTTAAMSKARQTPKGGRLI